MVELTRELVDQIIFGMENQEHEFYLDLESGELVSDEEGDVDSDDLEAIPDWTSVDGYNLMERFVLDLHNPIYRERLRRILASGRGVFRQFKDALRERQDIERLWFSFKEKQMRRVVADWYNEIREARGLEPLELSEEDDGLEVEALVLSDFVVQPIDGEMLETLDEMDSSSFEENFDDETERDSYYRAKRGGVSLRDGDFLRAIMTPAGESAGFIWADIDEGSRRGVIRQLYVRPEYRGIGLAHVLLRSALDDLAKQGVLSVSLELLGRAVEIQEAFFRQGFSVLAVDLGLDLQKWTRTKRDE